MRPTAKFSISFGLVTIPVAAYTATDSSASVSFVRIHTADGGRVRNQPVCSIEDIEVSQDEIGRGYKAGDDTVVPLSDADMDALPLPTAKTLTILAFVAGGDIDPLQMGKGYYLGVDSPAAAKPYVLLRDAMERHQRVGLGKVALHGRETLAMIRPVEGALVMQVLLWPHQIRPMDGVLPEREVEVAADEVAAAEDLMDSFGELSEDDVHDHYREALEEIVAAKLADREPDFKTDEEQPAAEVMDLMAALQNSVQAAKRSRGEDDAGGETTADEGGGRGGVTVLSGRTTKKSAARRSDAKKSTGSATKKTATRGSGTSTGKKSSGTGKKTAGGSGSGSGSGKKAASAKKTAGKGRRAS